MKSVRTSLQGPCAGRKFAFKFPVRFVSLLNIDTNSFERLFYVYALKKKLMFSGCMKKQKHRAILRGSSKEVTLVFLSCQYAHQKLLFR